MALELAVKAFRGALAKGASYHAEFDALVAASKRATDAQRDEAVRALLEDGDDHAEIAGILCVASGALVEDGASPMIGIDRIIDRMADGAELLATANLDDANLDEMRAAPPKELPENVRRWVAGWKSHVRGAMARLARSVDARKRLRAHPRFEPAVRALAERTWANHLRYVVEVLDMLDDEPLHVIDLCAGGTLVRYRAFGMRSGFHLMTVLDGYHPFTLSRATDYVHAKHGYFTWGALYETKDGFAANALNMMLWGEPRAADIPRFEGVRTIIRTPLPFARSWDAHFIAPVHEAMPEQLVVEKELSIEESRPILARIAAATKR
jgi:hypothetical protein